MNKCSQCGKKIKDKSGICENCGSKNEYIEFDVQQNVAVKEKSNMIHYLVISISVVLLLLAIFLIYFQDKIKEKEGNTNSSSTSQVSEAKVEETTTSLNSQVSKLPLSYILGQTKDIVEMILGTEYSVDPSNPNKNIYNQNNYEAIYNENNLLVQLNILKDGIYSDNIKIGDSFNAILETEKVLNTSSPILNSLDMSYTSFSCFSDKYIEIKDVTDDTTSPYMIEDKDGNKKEVVLSDNDNNNIISIFYFDSLNTTAKLEKITIVNKALLSTGYKSFKPVKKATVTITESVLRIRQTPSTEAEVLAEMPPSTEIEVLGQENEWYYVNYNGVLGYAHSEFISLK